MFRRYAVMSLDWTVARVTKVPRHFLPIVRFLAYPLIRWRMKQAAKVIATYEHLPPTIWEEVEKHGKNVVYGSHPAVTGFAKETIVFGIWVVDYTNKTYRIVFNIPDELAKVGKAF